MTAQSTLSELISLSGAVVSGLGLKTCRNCQIVLEDAASMFRVDIAARTALMDPRSRRMTAVVVCADFAQSCFEQEFTTRTGRAIDDGYASELAIGQTFFELTLLDGALEDGEEMVVRLPANIANDEFSCARGSGTGCRFGALSVVFLDAAMGSYSSEGITVINATYFRSSHDSLFVVAREIELVEEGFRYGRMAIAGMNVVFFQNVRFGKLNAARI